MSHLDKFDTLAFLVRTLDSTQHAVDPIARVTINAFYTPFLQALDKKSLVFMLIVFPYSVMQSVRIVFKGRGQV
ncbi:hypothetical protein [Type-D symbiont of Plautia stali]|uniref:hypothetical protein n=1 Tax=Type-D symbiont of Plautia stali TaxID=1560356 RepID=UPI001F1575F6|nr:hypothetical protein [Type-D symbiont of Plautia stali]